MRALRRRALLSALGALAAAAAAAQQVLVVDIDEALQASVAAAAIRTLETEERRALRAQLDALQRDLATEEAELTEMRAAVDRGEASRAVFDARVQAFEQKVRAARATARDTASALEERFAFARDALRAEVDPLLDALIAERGAVVVIEAGAVLRRADEVDATEALVARLNALWPASAASRLLPQPGPPPPRAIQTDP